MSTGGMILVTYCIMGCLRCLWLNPTNGSAWFLAIACTFLAVWDAFADYCGLTFTVSWRVRDIAEKTPDFLLYLGILIGHFFCNMRPE